MDQLFLLDSVSASIALGVIRLLGILGGIAVGRSVAGAWNSPVLLPLALLLLSAADQFVVFVVLQLDLWSMADFAVILVLVFAAGAYGFRSRRAEQMCRQYPWLFARAGLANWADHGEPRLP